MARTAPAVTLGNKLYFTYRRLHTNRGVEYDISYYNDKQYADYKEAGITNMIDGDNFLPSSKITKELVPGVKSLRKAGMLEYISADLEAELKASLEGVAQSFGIEIKTTEEMRQWLRDNTSCVEAPVGTFLTQEAVVDGIEGPEEAKYLIIS